MIIFTSVFHSITLRSLLQSDHFKTGTETRNLSARALAVAGNKSHLVSGAFTLLLSLQKQLRNNQMLTENYTKRAHEFIDIYTRN